MSSVFRHYYASQPTTERVKTCYYFLLNVFIIRREVAGFFATCIFQDLECKVRVDVNINSIRYELMASWNIICGRMLLYRKGNYGFMLGIFQIDIEIPEIL